MRRRTEARADEMRVGVLIQSAGLPKIDDVDRDRQNENGHPVLKIGPEKGEVPRQEFENVHRPHLIAAGRSSRPPDDLPANQVNIKIISKWEAASV